MKVCCLRIEVSNCINDLRTSSLALHLWASAMACFALNYFQKCVYMYVNYLEGWYADATWCLCNVCRLCVDCYMCTSSGNEMEIILKAFCSMKYVMECDDFQPQSWQHTEVWLFSDAIWHPRDLSGLNADCNFSTYRDYYLENIRFLHLLTCIAWLMWILHADTVLSACR